MLEDIKQVILSLPDKDFATFYQDYVVKSQDSIIEHDVNLATKDYTSIEDACQVIRGINKLTEELKQL